ncbi:MAG: UDP-3-O-(3-hydroxymyristoyl)glucosamine N-acyltransferase [Rhodobacteraceae bacterium]|nr:UDP-3-O-(3-hydroxymyristoyl)glucosamine N-acyltransferase [Paracoccaceae bacterium]
MTLDDITDALARRGLSYELAGPATSVTGVAPLHDCGPGDLVWSRTLAIAPERLSASMILLPRDATSPHPEAGDKSLIFVDNPRDAFRLLLGDVFGDQVAEAKGMTDSALFCDTGQGHGARVADDATIGENVVLHPNVVIYPNVVIGSNVEIGAGTIIGAPGYAFVRQPDGTLEHFPHIGGVEIGDNVTIGANSCVDSGGLGPTRIGPGTKIGNLCQIAHNVDLGSDCLLAGRVQIGGGTRVGDRTEIWPSSIISHKLVVGTGCDIKIGSVVVQNVPDGAAVSGNFAIPHDKSLRDFARKRR